MTEQDERRTRQMIEDVIGKPLEEILGRLNVLNANIARVEGNTERTEKHAEKTNGRVTKLEDEVDELKRINIGHHSSCPNTSAIQALKEESISRKSVMKFVVAVIGTTIAVLGLGISFIELIRK